MGWRSGTGCHPAEADELYERSKPVLRAAVGEEAWATLYPTTSYSFDPPMTGKIAVKVVNHYGDEVLKVYQVADTQV